MATIKPACIKRRIQTKIRLRVRQKKAKQATIGKLFTQLAIHINNNNKEFITRSARNHTKRSQYHEAI